MGHIREIYPELERCGARVVVVLAEKQERIKSFLEHHTYPFPLLSDGGRQVVKEYGVYVRVNFESLHIARPAVFILDREGIIRYIFIASIQFEYAEDDDIFSTLDAMREI
jgi:peroxiredoxin